MTVSTSVPSPRGRLLPHDPLRCTAMHEAAHAVVSLVLGWPVESMQILGRGRARLAGTTTLARTPPDPVWATIAAAGDTWDSELSPYAYKDQSCSDLKTIVRLVGISAGWQARTEASRILAGHRREVERLAERQVRAPGHLLRFAPR